MPQANLRPSEKMFKISQGMKPRKPESVLLQMQLTALNSLTAQLILDKPELLRALTALLLRHEGNPDNTNQLVRRMSSSLASYGYERLDATPAIEAQVPATKRCRTSEAISAAVDGQLARNYEAAGPSSAEDENEDWDPADQETTIPTSLNFTDVEGVAFEWSKGKEIEKERRQEIAKVLSNLRASNWLPVEEIDKFRKSLKTHFDRIDLPKDCDQMAALLRFKLEDMKKPPGSASSIIAERLSHLMFNLHIKSIKRRAELKTEAAMQAAIRKASIKYGETVESLNAEHKKATAVFSAIQCGGLGFIFGLGPELDTMLNQHGVQRNVQEAMILLRQADERAGPINLTPYEKYDEYAKDLLTCCAADICKFPENGAWKTLWTPINLLSEPKAKKPSFRAAQTPYPNTLSGNICVSPTSDDSPNFRYNQGHYPSTSNTDLVRHDTVPAQSSVEATQSNFQAHPFTYVQHPVDPSYYYTAIDPNVNLSPPTMQSGYSTQLGPQHTYMSQTWSPVLFGDLLWNEYASSGS